MCCLLYINNVYNTPYYIYFTDIFHCTSKALPVITYTIILWTTKGKELKSNTVLSYHLLYRSILIIHAFCICRFADLLKCICNPKSVFMALS